MNFIKRFSDSMFAPKEVFKYRNDKWYITTLFFILLVILSVIPSSITVIMNQGLDYEDKKDIKMLFIGENIHFEIVDNKLVNKTPELDTYTKKINNGINVLFTVSPNYDSSIFKSGISILFMEDGAYIAQSILHQKLFAYEDYPTLNGLQFNKLGNYNSLEWDRIFSVIDNEYKEIKPLLTTVSIIMLFFATLIDLLIISFALTFFQAFTLSRFIRFTKFWKLSIYLLTPYIFGNVLTLLFDIGIFHYIGLFASAIYIIILGRSIVKQSIWKE